MAERTFTAKDAEKYISVPFVRSGRERDTGLDCVGLLLDIYKTHAPELLNGIDTGEMDEWSLLGVKEAEMQFLRFCHKVSPMHKKAFDILLFNLKQKTLIGICLSDDDYFLFTSPDTGVVRQQFGRSRFWTRKLTSCSIFRRTE